MSVPAHGAVGEVEGSGRPELESRVLGLHLDGYSYQQIGVKLACEAKTVDNALQRVKRKVAVHFDERAVAA